MSEIDQGLMLSEANPVALEREYRFWVLVICLLIGLIALLSMTSLALSLLVEIPDAYLSTYAGNVIPITSGAIR